MEGDYFTSRYNKLKTTLVVNDRVVPLNEFVQDYIGNILRAMVASLGFYANRINLYIESGEIRLYADDQQVPIRKDFVRLLIESTIKGVLSPLRGIFWLERIIIVTE
jgi:hypothetical protein